MARWFRFFGRARFLVAGKAVATGVVAIEDHVAAAVVAGAADAASP